MPEQQGIVKVVSGRRGRGPGMISVLMAEEETPLNLTSFDSALLKQAAFLINKEVKVSWEEKQSKDGTRTFLNLQTLQGTGSQDRSEAPGSIVEAEVIPPQRETGQTLVPVVRPVVQTLSPIQQLEQSFALAVRQRELLEDFVKKRMKKDVHYMDGKIFGSAKPVLLQPGAQLILYCHGYAIDFEVLVGPPPPPIGLEEEYTIVVKAIALSSAGRQVGAAVGSAGSLIWSGRQNRLVARAADPEKALNTTYKMAQKRALVSLCNNATASSEFFTVDLEPDSTIEKEASTKRRFIRPA